MTKKQMIKVIINDYKKYLAGEDEAFIIQEAGDYAKLALERKSIREIRKAYARM